MPRRVSLLLLTIAVMATAVMGGEWREADRFVEKGVMGIGYDDGASVRLFITDDISAYLSVGYLMSQGEVSDYDTTRNNLSMGSLKIGGEYKIKELGRFSFNGFGEYKEIIQQREADMGDGSLRRYNQSNRNVTFGVRPEFFITPHISIDYKMGWQWRFEGDTFKNNGQDGLVSMDNSSAEVGFYSTSVGEASNNPISSAFFNFGLTFYISDLF